MPTSAAVDDIFTIEPPPDAVSSGIAARQPGVLAGSDIAAEVFRRVDPVLKIERLREDGAALQPGDACLEVSGASRSILTAERKSGAAPPPSAAAGQGRASDPQAGGKPATKAGVSGVRQIIAVA